ncbi:hypothetical protein [Virgibacillus senegalensis]|uniref:hypothetical protein n=1 Tax=Virgibacillus senegalensis TaxID=1499679 RepID=UPI00069EA481|nr:hypothetical protein [Virgibacillus senegalensis]
MVVETINRDAGDKSKGFRLQRLRAIELLLDKMEVTDGTAAVFASTEYLDDVYIKTVTPEESSTYTEGDKNYDKTKKFSFMSHEVTNSLIIFLDNWLNCDLSENLYYCFYTNVDYTYERKTKLLKDLEIDLPKSPILDCLVRNQLDQNIIDCIKKRLIYEYKQQYKNQKGNGYLDIIEKFNEKDWFNFLSRIRWKFGQYDDKELEKYLVRKIKTRTFYNNIDVSGKEEIIIDLLAAKFEAHEQYTDPIANNVSAIHVENVLLKLSKDIVKKSDPVFDIWNSLEPPADNRGLKQKIIDVDSAYKKYKVGVKARQVAVIREEYEQLTDQEKGSYRYRVFEACQQKLVSLLESKKEVDIDLWLDELFIWSKQHIKDKSKDYSYAMKSDDAIKGAILELIDSCFLSFDEKGFYDGNI